MIAPNTSTNTNTNQQLCVSSSKVSYLAREAGRLVGAPRGRVSEYHDVRVRFEAADGVADGLPLLCRGRLGVDLHHLASAPEHRRREGRRRARGRLVEDVCEDLAREEVVAARALHVGLHLVGDLEDVPAIARTRKHT